MPSGDGPGRVLSRSGSWHATLLVLAVALAALSFARWWSYRDNPSVASLVLFGAGWWHLGTSVALLAGRNRANSVAAAAVSGVLAAGWVVTHATGQDGVMSLVAIAWFVLEVTSAVVGCFAARAAAPSARARWSSGTVAMASTLVVLGVLVSIAGAPDPTSAGAPAGGRSSAEPAEPTTTVVTTMTEVPLDPADRELLAEQLTLARAAAMRYPTVADARSAGMTGGTNVVPGSGVHFQFLGAAAAPSIRADGTFDATMPGAWMYAGTAADAPVVGVMYNTVADAPPQGFAGDRDVWHQHESVCMRVDAGNLVLPLDGQLDVTKADCDRVGGEFADRSSWMLHAWVAPGWESPDGVFSHENPAIRCPDDSDAVDASGVCLAS